MILRFKTVEALHPVDVFMALKNQDNLLFLDSADSCHPDARYSYVMCDPSALVYSRNGSLIFKKKGAAHVIDNSCVFEFLKSFLCGYDRPEQIENGHPPFLGGFAGYFGYDLARGLEKLPDICAYDADMPDMALGLYECVYVFDHEKGEGRIYAHGQTDTEASEKIERFEILVTGGLCDQKFITPPDFAPQWRENFSRKDYESRIGQVIDYIRSGDIFQANLTRRFDADLPDDFDPFMHYLYLRHVNPAPFAAYFEAGENLVLSSASPERFLKVDADGCVQTKPIKGTRPVIENDTAANQAQIDNLLSSEKDRAENVMIVDLLRNDLSKSCRPDSVDVPALCALESFAGVHHLVSTVTGRLKAGASALDLLKGCFPGGSITGAPKIRAMEIIEELEPTRRGPYCGALGYIGFDGAMDLNILIRTLVYWKGAVSFQVGGGIVADSDPSEEFEETLTKANGLLRSFSSSL
jgi:para-aminobenzoate synthetase component I